MKTIIKTVVSLSFLSLLFAGVAFGQSSDGEQNENGRNTPKVSVSITPDTIMIGDRFVMRVEVEKDIAQFIAFPDMTKAREGDTVELVSISPIDTLFRDGRRVRLAVDYTLTCFEPGLFGLGRVPLFYGDKNVRDTLYTNEESTRFVVKSFDIDTLNQKITDIKTVRDTPLNFSEIMAYATSWPVLLALAVITVIVIALILWRRYRKGAKDKTAVVNEPPHCRAIRRLEELSERKLWQNGKIKEFYTALSDILREYISQRYDFPALEMTTAELVDTLEKTEVPPKECKRVSELLTLADLVKFAKYTPALESHNEAYREAYIFVEETKQAVVTLAEMLAKDSVSEDTHDGADTTVTQSEKL